MPRTNTHNINNLYNNMASLEITIPSVMFYKESNLASIKATISKSQLLIYSKKSEKI